MSNKFKIIELNDSAELIYFIFFSRFIEICQKGRKPYVIRNKINGKTKKEILIINDKDGRLNRLLHMHFFIHD